MYRSLARFCSQSKSSEARLINTRLNPYHQVLAEGGIPPVTYEYEKEKWAQQRRFGTFGLASGVDIRRLWPTVQEVEEQKALKMYRKYPEAAEIAEQRQQEEAKAASGRLAEIRRNEAKYENADS